MERRRLARRRSLTLPAFMILTLLTATLVVATPDSAPLAVRQLAPGVYAVLGDSGRGSEGRPNAGFVVTHDGVVAIDAEAHPRDARRMIAAIRQITQQPIVWLILTHHHPDHHFGAVEFRRAGAKVIAHPDRRALALEGGEDALTADWARLHGLDALLGFEFADVPDRPVTGSDTLSLGGTQIVIRHPGAAHSAGDLLVWLPREKVLFAGDLLVEDGVTMVVDGNSLELLRALDTVQALRARWVVPGHGRLPRDPIELIGATRTYISGLRQDMRAAVEAGTGMQRTLASLPPADVTRPVSLNSRKRRNAVRVYVEVEKEVMGL